MANLDESLVLYRLNEVIVYLVDINKIEDNDGNAANGVGRIESSNARGTSSSSDSKEFVCSGPLCVVNNKGARVLIVGPLNAPKFKYELPSAFCVLSKQEITCRGPTKGVIRVIQVVNPGVGDMDELADALSKCECMVSQPRYEDRTERWAYRARIAGKSLGWVIGKASSLAAHGIEKVGEAARNNIEPETEDTEVSPEMQKVVKKTKQATSALVKGVDYLISGAVLATTYVVKKAASELRDDAAEENPNVTSGITIAESAISATVEVWQSIQDAKDKVFSSTTDETAKTVGHKYGDQAEAVTRDGLQSVQNVVEVSSIRTPKKFLKSAGKMAAVGAGKSLLTPDVENTSSPSQSASPREEPLNIQAVAPVAQLSSADDAPPSEQGNGASAAEDDGFVIVNMAHHQDYA